MTREPDDDTRTKIAAFDLVSHIGKVIVSVMLRTKLMYFLKDGTLILTASGRTFAKDEDDWKWFSLSVPKKLESLHKDG